MKWKISVIIEYTNKYKNNKDLMMIEADAQKMIG
jgi:hypothetical protein